MKKDKIIFLKRCCVILFGPVLFFGLYGLCFSQNLQVSLFGGMTYVAEYGSEEDYEFGANDFPVTPAHSPAVVGASVLYLFSGDRFALELDGRLTQSSKVTLTDPSDDDTVEIDTARHFSLGVNALYYFRDKGIRPYILAGGGMDRIQGENKTYTTEYGYEFDVFAPEDPDATDWYINLGAGIQYDFGENLGVRADARYIIIFTDPDNLDNLNGTIGICFRF